jgi:hypothetical protein
MAVIRDSRISDYLRSPRARHLSVSRGSCLAGRRGNKSRTVKPNLINSFPTRGGLNWCVLANAIYRQYKKRILYSTKKKKIKEEKGRDFKILFLLFSFCC